MLEFFCGAIAVVLFLDFVVLCGLAANIKRIEEATARYEKIFKGVTLVHTQRKDKNEYM